MIPLTVAMVYKKGRGFTSASVSRLARGIHRHLTVPFRLVCLTDEHADVMRHVGVGGAITLRHDWPGWWSKMELFRLPGPVLYFDLDTVIVGSIDDLVRAVTAHEFVMLSDFYRPQLAQSGIMAWRGDASFLLEEFTNQIAGGSFDGWPPRLITQKRRWRGDGEWVREHVQDLARVQDICTGVCSYKVNNVTERGLPEDARVVCFHGRPRPHEVTPRPVWMEEDEPYLLRQMCVGQVCEITAGQSHGVGILDPSRYSTCLLVEPNWPSTDTLLFCHALKQVPDESLEMILRRICWKDRRPRLVIIEQMDPELRRDQFERSPLVYMDTLKAMGWDHVEVRVSVTSKGVQHAMVAESC